MSKVRVISPKEVREEANPVLRECQDLPFLCKKCGALLAFIDKETRAEVRVKYRDLYLGAVDPETFWILCRSCGLRNELNKVKLS